MFITMQGNWNVRVKSKNAAFPQRFIISGAVGGPKIYEVGDTAIQVEVVGTRWTIAIQHDPGSGYQLSDAKIKFPRQIGGNYVFDIESNDSGADQDFDDLILTCSRPATPNNFIVYGNVSLYSGNCFFNPCRRDVFPIETLSGLEAVLKNPVLRSVIERLYPERIPPKLKPNLPDPPPYFRPIVFDLFGEATQPKTTVKVRQPEGNAKNIKSTAKEVDSPSVNNFSLEEIVTTRKFPSEYVSPISRSEIAKAIDGFLFRCGTEAGSGLNLSFEEYDRTVSEQAGGAYTGTGNRRLLGETITDMFGNYIFCFAFDMTFPGLEDADDSFPGQSVNEYAYPDVIVKVTGAAPWDVLYESAPYYNIPNLKRINICLPRSTVRVVAACANGNLIGGLGSVAIGGNQNTSASDSSASLIRDDYNNRLDENGVVTVNNSQAGFGIECAAWTGVIDIFGCIYDETKHPTDNKIRWYTIRIKRKGTPDWTYVAENYKHENLNSSAHDHLADVGPFPRTIGGVADVPAYKNMRYENNCDHPERWKEFRITCLIRLNSGFYDMDSGEHKPGTFYLRIDGYDDAGNHVPGATDMIALYIHNNGINFGLTEPQLTDPSIVSPGCRLYRLTNAQNNTPMTFSFRANDTAKILSGVPPLEVPYGFLDNYSLTMTRCPSPTIALLADPMPDTAAGVSLLAGGSSTSVHNSCNGYTGTYDDFARNDGLIPTTLQPDATKGEVGWIKATEYFVVYDFTLTANQRVTNGYNSGLGVTHQTTAQIMMEKLNP